MKEQTIFELIHSMDNFTNNLIIQWNKTFNEELGVSHILVLGHLQAKGKSRPSDIAKSLGLTPATLTHLSEKLVQKKLAVRLTDEFDRRIIYIQITDMGIDMVYRANQEGQLLRRKLFEKLTEEEREQLVGIYRKLNS
ncbi:DNA-binding transcriptional regulator, MarR family [Paenisporosarcina quisquiliarum]|jgi:DNA-binding MarR family transcriptional regulator|uniref:MarR family winged helix-turn-helix transcriptional regulator n=1 Tax=Psychrobacillus TaxID=1221880 RepID=UPI0008C8642A|nr:MarR family transcriptional regulator [Psychrobacillus psychrodurans]MCK1997857.1 MarR family transcriptional regulator [Psychrobacillus psychrodurans]MCZ8541040.1 MarR family transcriptional regulator [Psychrobacillus psychrodurans]SEN29832.1 DNA-binding transcriptional regulator, MarR family [Paenisporosarcina quisquiliarum]SFM83252.1 DNA-binding transcriptional regulator, MarR family [Psychrobacillus psychrodurans]